MSKLSFRSSFALAVVMILLTACGKKNNSQIPVTADSTQRTQAGCNGQYAFSGEPTPEKAFIEGLKKSYACN